MSALGHKYDLPDGSVWVVTVEYMAADPHGNEMENRVITKLPPTYVTKRGPNQWMMVKELSAPRPLTKD